MLASLRVLRRYGVLGLNRRNADFISLVNPRSHYPLVDDKIRTKRLALEAGITVPELYHVVREQHEIDEIAPQLAERGDFVVKPAHGSGGSGILVIRGRQGNRFRKTDDRLIDAEELLHHISNALSGLYSLGGQRDRVMIEYRVRHDPVFGEITYRGVPDVRIIVYRGYPAMAMVRLPTSLSQGRANLHQGAVGVGVDLARGTTLEGVLGNDRVREHPDTGRRLAGRQIPAWERILEIASQCYEATGLGYLGADLVVDREHGPMLLELNARPGLQIQVANACGLRPRLAVIDAEADPAAAPADRVDFSRARFHSLTSPTSGPPPSGVTS
jgi:alpha-L-glutamate ligase-like protein